MRPTTWLAVVVGVTGAVGPLGAVGTTGAGADHEIGAAVADWVPDEDPPVPDEGWDVDVLAVVGVDELAPAGDVGRDADPAALVVVDGAPLVVEGDPEPPKLTGPAS
jgi:hypothetical protein